MIEVHLRRNHDFDAMPEALSAFPVWEGEPVPEDMVPDPEDADGLLVPRRLGFVYRVKKPFPLTYHPGAREVGPTALAVTTHRRTNDMT